MRRMGLGVFLLSEPLIFSDLVAGSSTACLGRASRLTWAEFSVRMRGVVFFCFRWETGLDWLFAVARLALPSNHLN